MTLPDGLVARASRPADAPAIDALTRACDETYREWAPAGWSPPEVASGWSARLQEPGRWSLVAMAGVELVAFAAFRPAFDRDAPGGPAGPPLPGVAHVGALLVHPSRWGQGVGAAMLARAEAAMRERGFSQARLWTPAGAPAEAYYRACGWAPDGRTGFHDWLGLAVVGYAKSL